MKIKLILLLFILWGQLLFGQTPINFDFDYARFKYDSTADYLELYYSIQQNTMTKIPKENGFNVAGSLTIQIKSDNSDSLLIDKNWEINSFISDTLSQNRSLIGVLGFILNEGKYNVNITLSDAADPAKSKTISESIDISVFPEDQFSISDVQIASSIKQEGADSNSIFYKNTLEVVPNPMMVFGEQSPVLYYYVELYNLMKDTDQENSLILKSSLVNSKNALISEKQRDISKSIDSRVEVGTINLSKFPTDSYTLVISLLDTVNNLGISSAKRFYIYNPSIKDTTQIVYTRSNIYESEYNILSEEEVDDLFEKSKYIATGAEIDRFKKLNDIKAKREFMYNFWQKRDANIATPQNEYKDEFMRRIDQSNEKYGTMRKKGMRTDRGRVFIIYGEPDEIDRYPSSVDSKPYEIWHYNQIEGGVVFVFGDITGFSDYELLHSTKRGELRDDNWNRRIRQN